MIAVCDAWDAMTTDRPYRRAMAHADALAELERCSGTQFDPAVVKVFRARARAAAAALAGAGLTRRYSLGWKGRPPP